MNLYRFPLTAIDVEETRRYAGLAKAGEAFPEKLLQAACQEGLLYIEGRATWTSYGYDHMQGLIKSPRPYQLEGQDILKHLSKAEEVVILAATIGPELEKAVEEHFASGLYTHAVLLDAVGTTAIEAIANQANRLIEEEAKRRGYEATWRFSPGYGDWELSVQGLLLSLTEANRLPLDLTTHSMLQPQKSITAIIGLIPREEREQADIAGSIICRNQCASCKQKNCPARKESIR
ncbi:methionine synthase [Heliorestis acidaminivorans]|uniref:Methionine synthase n=1 Tax=Heliorestis acidaminivorans TaxID=553427 RepID=A0A6I0ESF8_9FIRM|nr:methionine synthase [Heliorestis acidaminivorans]KAB2951792.1 methionine synthase [Heliorestis acidaminivorans]